MTDIKSAFVLGSNGFIGSHLVARLRDDGAYVVGIDQVEAFQSTLGLLLPQKFVQLRLPDVQFARMLREYKPEVVINAAGPASVSASLANPVMDFQGSVQVCFHILEGLRENLPGCKFLQLSSAAVYGNPSELPIQECAALAPISPYGYNKWICEILAQEYTQTFNLNTCTARIFSAFGPGLRKQLLWDIYEKSKIDKPIQLFGSGDETRDFIYIDDIIRIISMIIEKGQFRGDVYNLANGNEVSIRALTSLFLEKLGLDGRDAHFSGLTKPGDPKRWRADIKKIEQLGYAPQLNLEKGLAEYAAWVKGVNSNRHE